MTSLEENAFDVIIPYFGNGNSKNKAKLATLANTGEKAKGGHGHELGRTRLSDLTLSQMVQYR